MKTLLVGSSLLVVVAMLHPSASLAASHPDDSAHAVAPDPGTGDAQALEPQTQAPQTSAMAVNDSGIADIVVTAQRRSENIQKSSLSVSVVSSEQLGRQGVTSTQDISRIAPGVQIGASSPTPQIYIRGVGDPGTTAVTNPAIALNVGGVYAARPASAATAFYDVDRIEVLKGPQGTLYGRNASGGAINILPTKPHLDAVQAVVNIEGGNYDLLGSDGAVNLPLGDTLALRASYQIRHRDGYLSDGSGDDIRQAARLQFLFEPSDALSILLYGSYAHQGGVGNGSVLYDPAGNPASTPPRLATAPFDPWTSITDPRAAAILTTLAAPPVLLPGNRNDLYQNNVYWNAQAEIVADLGFAKLTVIPAYQHARLDYRYYSSVDFQTRDKAGKGDPETDETYSAEARLSNESEKLKWVIGLFYYNEDQNATATLNNGLIQDVSISSRIKTRSIAAFGNATYSITDSLRVIGGLRYSDDKRSLHGFRYNNRVSVTAPVSAVGGNTSLKHVDYKGGFEFDLAPRNMLYAVFATGYKSGGLSNAVISPFLPETVQSYTIGSRNRFFENRLQVNLEGFYLKYRNQQVQVLGPDDLGVLSGFIRNAGQAKSYGAEADIAVQLGKHDRLTGNLTYNHTNYDSFVYLTPAVFLRPGSTGCIVTPTGTVGAAGPVSSVNCSGHDLLRAPTWAGSIGYSHSMDLGDAGSLTFNGDMQFASGREATNDFIANTKLPAYQVFNASLTYAVASDKLSVTGFVRNIGNEAVYLGGMQGTFVPSYVGMSIAPPRTYGLRLSYHY